MRTLSIQSANGSNAVKTVLPFNRMGQLADRNKQNCDITNISVDRTYLMELQGIFQVGADANQTISFSMQLSGQNNSVNLLDGGFTMSWFVLWCSLC